MAPSRSPAGSAAKPGGAPARQAEYDGQVVRAYPPLPSRRDFLMSWAGVAWVTFAGAAALEGGILQRFLFPNVLFEPPMTFKAGYPEEYEQGVSEKWKQTYAVWIVRQGAMISALSTTCTHLGCTPNWLGAEQKFKCPCHGSGFRPTGINFEGPAPRPLERYRIVRDPVDGQIVVDKSRKFQFEKGQWDNPESYVKA